MQVLTGFAEGLVETLRDMLGPDASITITPPPTVLFNASLTAAHPPQFVEVKLKQDGQLTRVYHIEEAFWQHVVHRPSLVDIARWLWNLVLRLTRLRDNLIAWLTMGLVGFATFLGQTYLVLMTLDAARRGLAAVILWVVKFVSGQPQLPAWATQLADRTLVGIPGSVVGRGWLVVTAVLLAAGVTRIWAALRQMMQERAIPWGWRGRAPWYAGSAFLSLGLGVASLILLYQLMSQVEIPFPGRDSILNSLGGLVEWLQQDALADGMIYGSSEKRPQQTQKAMQNAVKSKVQDFPKEFERIHLVAHSLGSIVTFEILSSLNTEVGLPRDQKQRIHNFFTAGSPLIKFLDVLADDPLTRVSRRWFLNRVITLTRYLASPPAGRRGMVWLDRLNRIGLLTDAKLARVILSPRVMRLAGTWMLKERLQGRNWSVILAELQDLRTRRVHRPYPKRFDGTLPSKDLHEDFQWFNMVADRDIVPDRLEKKPHFPPPASVTGQIRQGLENYPGTVEDIHVKSTRGLSAHSAYWDRGCETLRYTLEQIDPEVFGERFHDLMQIRKAQLRAAEARPGTLPGDVWFRHRLAGIIVEVQDHVRYDLQGRRTTGRIWTPYSIPERESLDTRWSYHFWSARDRAWRLDSLPGANDPHPAASKALRKLLYQPPFTVKAEWRGFFAAHAQDKGRIEQAVRTVWGAIGNDFGEINIRTGSLLRDWIVHFICAEFEDAIMRLRR
jgi:hypothetical protein